MIVVPNVNDEALQSISAATGLDLSKLKSLLPMLAPLLVSAVAQAKPASPSSLTELLQAARQHIGEQIGNADGYVKNNPHDVKSALVGAGAALAGQFLLGKLFGK